ncbi:MAG: zinc ribbon domain-containing protein [Ignavibacteria bacterium]|nr:zinc ribbon domain-containing protein [Ignavibacteria bacterium]
MPIFEYKCNDCGKKFDVLHKSTTNLEEVNCPDCQSKNHKKLLSSFSASVGNSSSFSGTPSCSDGSCGIPSYSGCASGTCGLN